MLDKNIERQFSKQQRFKRIELFETLIKDSKSNINETMIFNKNKRKHKMKEKTDKNRGSPYKGVSINGGNW